jgi:hypothetical protein
VRRLDGRFGSPSLLEHLRFPVLLDIENVVLCPTKLRHVQLTVDEQAQLSTELVREQRIRHGVCPG